MGILEHYGQDLEMMDEIASKCHLFPMSFGGILVIWLLFLHMRLINVNMAVSFAIAKCQISSWMKCPINAWSIVRLLLVAMTTHACLIRHQNHIRWVSVKAMLSVSSCEMQHWDTVHTIWVPQGWAKPITTGLISLYYQLIISSLPTQQTHIPYIECIHPVFRCNGMYVESQNSDDYCRPNAPSK